MPDHVNIGGGFFGGMRLSISELQPEHILKDSEVAKLYSIGSSKRLGKPITELNILDTDSAITIAVNYDEEVIALDYRNNPDNPRVLGSFFPRDYVLLANTFEEFAEKTNLIPPKTDAE